jgi:hypothetical protein
MRYNSQNNVNGMQMECKYLLYCYQLRNNDKTKKSAHVRTDDNYYYFSNVFNLWLVKSVGMKPEDTEGGYKAAKSQ